MSLTFFESTQLLSLPNYNPAPFLDEMQRRLGVANDRALASVLRSAPPTISKIRARRLPITANMLLRMHEASGITVADLRRMLGGV